MSTLSAAAVAASGVVHSGNGNGSGGSADVNGGGKTTPKFSRSLSASTLKDALSKLATTPLNVTNPVAVLQANVEYVIFS